jgi:hypothetical protein
MATFIDGRLHPSRFTAAAAGVSSDIMRSHYAIPLQELT